MYNAAPNSFPIPTLDFLLLPRCTGYLFHVQLVVVGWRSKGDQAPSVGVNEIRSRSLKCKKFIERIARGKELNQWMRIELCIVLALSEGLWLCRRYRVICWLSVGCNGFMTTICWCR